MRRYFILIPILLAVTVFPARAQESAPTLFISDNGQVSVVVPEGWTATYEPETGLQLEASQVGLTDPCIGN
jgi:hypothetical protein